VRSAWDTARGAAILALAAGAGAPRALAAAQSMPGASALAPATTPAARAIDFEEIKGAMRIRPAAQELPGARADVVAADLEDYAAYLKWQRDYARRGWEWHLLSTKVLFCVVAGVVLFGMALTLVQFRRDYSGWQHPGVAARGDGGEAKAKADEPRAPATALLPTSMKIGPGGLEVTSQVIGLLILTFSLAFFYFYVKEVYPIRAVGWDEAAARPDAGAHPQATKANAAEAER
jgi:hypothetical protein